MSTPIAIVGRGCVLPHALDPDQFSRNIMAGRLSVSPVPQGGWGLPAERPAGEFSGHGGYVTGFDNVFDPNGFVVDAERIRPLDPLFHWVLHGAREALREAGYAETESVLARTGLVLGNLSYPSTEGARFAERIWFPAREKPTDGGRRPDARNRFSSGLPALFAAEALGLGAGAYALDAACASSLYAIKLAADRLHDHSADLMLAGGINRADNLVLHGGFHALGASSSTGRSRPFHRDADGLLPAEGAGFVALMRLADAIAAGVPIFGVIRGAGVANDGRAKGLLAPSQDGQERALRLAYAAAALSPESVTLVECHATGTAVGDAVEARAMARVFAGRDDLPIGSAKSNIGHALAAAGMAGLLKVLGAMRAGVRPPTLGAEEPIADLAGTPLRLVTTAEDWPGPRRAGISSFGFGGVNAHLIVDEWTESSGVAEPMPPTAAEDPVVIVALGARVGDGPDTADFRCALLEGQTRRGRRVTIDSPVAGLRFPPRDLDQALPQQVLMLAAARDAATGIRLPRERTMVVIGMGVDAEAARTVVGGRVRSWSTGAVDGDLLDRWAQAWCPPLSAAHVVGTMPNIVANRISTQLDLAGPSFTVSAEESSGIVAVELAARALRAGEIDAAVVGAVDLSHEPVHQAALAELGLACPPGDAAIALVLKRLSVARRDGDQVLAALDEDLMAGGEPDLLIGRGGFDPVSVFGSAHAASGLVAVAVAVTALQHRAIPHAGGPARRDPRLRTAEVVLSPMEGPPARLRLRAADLTPWVRGPAPRLHVYSGRDSGEVLAAMAAGRESTAGPARLAIVVRGRELPARRDAARHWMTRGGPRPAGIAYRETPIGGEVGFVFTNGSACHPEMGRALPLAFPEVIDAMDGGRGTPGTDPGAPQDVLEQICGAARLAGWHVGLTRDLLGIRPHAAIGYSSGESAALVALGAWTDPVEFSADARASGLFTVDLTGEIPAVARAWQRRGLGADRWSSYLVSAPDEAVRAALADQPSVHLMALNAPGVCVVGGASGACAEVVRGLDPGAIAIDYDLAAHAPELAEVRQRWRALHDRDTRDVPGVRFYSGVDGHWYTPTRERAADALTAQALGTIDFVGVVKRAWADGVRVFVEHGPGGLCTSWIRRILPGRDYLAVSLDAPGEDGIRQLCFAVAELAAAGVPVRAEELFGRLAVAAAMASPDPGEVVTMPAHLPEVPPLPVGFPAATMLPAPRLAPVLLETLTAPAIKVAVMPRTSRALIAVAGHRQRVTELHQDFLRQQTELHRSFHDTRHRGTAALIAAARRPRATVPAALSRPPAGGVPLPGPKFDRAQLEMLASGPVSQVLGPLFAEQDTFVRQTRLPGPPLLLVDRVTGIDAKPVSMGTGTIWTETDIPARQWYLDATGRMPFSLMVEAGQADLVLISWLGADLLTRGERVYRLLGCELTYHGRGLPRPGDTLRYEIHIDSHVEHNGIRLFFFRYDCHLGAEHRLSVRQGQAGFFSDRELAESGGVHWDPRACPPPDGQPQDRPAVQAEARGFDARAVRAFVEGRPFDCFGPGWEKTRAHLRSPRSNEGRMWLLDEVSEFDPDGGPWGRGYLRAEMSITPDCWFFDAHFLDDPCMPGTMVLEAGMQAMTFYLAAMGFTIERDGWCFEPVPDRPYTLRCRGQISPQSHTLTIELFVSAVSAGPEPTLVADMLGTVDGVKAIHGSQVAIRLIPDWPLEQWCQLGPKADHTAGDPVRPETLAGVVGHREADPAVVVDGFTFDYRSLLACAWGRPSEAFGPAFAAFDGPRRLARLPGPPYHFLSRIVSVDGPPGGMRVGSGVTAEYDVPEQAWYFTEHADPVMPFAVLMEIALQPCGWLSMYVGSPLSSAVDLAYRNLDGTARVLAEIRPDSGTVRTEVELRTSARHGDMIIQSFVVRCLVGAVPVMELETVFGFFTAAALAEQIGLTPSDEDVAALAEPSEYRAELTEGDNAYRVAGPMLLMLDRVTGYWPAGGSAGLGRVRAEKDVDAGEWFFQAHFFTDPVQPGSLGVEAMYQLLRFYLLEFGSHRARPGAAARWEPVRPERTVTWKYRGQVVPAHERITIDMDIVEVGDEHVVADAWLWVDGLRIYQVRGLALRLADQPRRAVPARNTRR